MKGKDILEAINDIDTDMIADAEEYSLRMNGHGQRMSGRILFAAAMIIAAAACFGMNFITSGRLSDEADITVSIEPDGYVVTEKMPETAAVSGLQNENDTAYIEPNDAYTVTGSELGLILLDMDTGVVELNPAKSRDYFDSVVWDSRNYSINMENIFKEAERKAEASKRTMQDIRYLVQIDISAVEDMNGKQIITLADGQIKKEEYERLTRECGYELEWLPPGGYRIPGSYLYCLVNGRIYGTMTEEQIRNFEDCDKYGYTITLISYENVEMKNWEYEESYTDSDLRDTIWHSLHNTK